MSRKFKKSRDYLQKGPKNLVIMVILLVVSFAMLQYFAGAIQKINTLSYRTFIDKVEQDEVKAVLVEGNEIRGTLTDNKPFETVFPEGDKDLWPLLKAHKIDIVARSANTAGQFTFWHFLLLMMAILGGMGVWHFLRQTRGGGSGGGGGLFNMGKSKAKMFMPSMLKETFDSVAGADEAKEELKDIVDYLKNPSKFGRLGAKMTRGVLLVGEPGTGKTLLARAVAGEANCPFFSISGSDFIEVFVGLGAARVRDLFTQARKHAPCIVFIDEIDAVGRRRGGGMGGGNDEREQTLNQLLAEMDGFSSKKGVIIMAATNRPDVLDVALLRPGRFDRQITVDRPDLLGREAILNVHKRNVKLAPDVNMKVVAKRTPGFSGADLANVVNEAALLAARRDKEAVEMPEFEDAIDRVIAGPERKSRVMSEDEKRTVAYHESGHALIAAFLPHADPVHKVSIIPRGAAALGYTLQLPTEDRYLTTESEIMDTLCVLLGGRAAESMVV